MLLLSLVMVCSCQPFADDLDYDSAEAPRFRASVLDPMPDPGSPARLKVMAWNIKYGANRLPFWFDCWGDRVQMSQAEVEANMQRLYALIKEVDPDILLVEEIEVNSRRSSYYDMVQGFLDNTPLNYAAYYETWNSRYIPSEGLGRMHLGNAIFSRYPITSATGTRQEDRTDQDFLTATFYIHRVVGRAEIELPSSQHVAVYVIHTEAYDNDGTKQKQIKQIKDIVDAETLPWLLGGDFNELPPTAVRLKNFPDERTQAVCSEDFVQPPYTPQVMQPFYDAFAPHIPLAAYGTTEESQRRYFTHSVLGPDEVNETGVSGYWNRTLDYLFAGPGQSWVQAESDVLQVAGQQIGQTGRVLVADPLRLSDHAPVVGVWEVAP